MEDLNAKIAARRQELSRQQEQQKLAETRATAAQQRAVQVEKHAAVAQVAQEMTAAGIATTADAGELNLVVAPPPPLDVEGLKRSAVERLIKREARLLWTPFENWLVIGCIVGGVCLLHLAGVGVVPLLLGLHFRSANNKRYRRIVRERIEPAITT